MARAVDRNGVPLTRGMRVEPAIVARGTSPRRGVIVGTLGRDGVFVRWDGDADDQVVAPDTLFTVDAVHAGRRRA